MPDVRPRSSRSPPPWRASCCSGAGRRRPLPRHRPPDGAAAGLLLLPHRRRADSRSSRSFSRWPPTSSRTSTWRTGCGARSRPSARPPRLRRTELPAASTAQSGRVTASGVPWLKTGDPAPWVEALARPGFLVAGDRLWLAVRRAAGERRGSSSSPIRARSVAPGARGPDRVRGRRRGGAGLRGQPADSTVRTKAPPPKESRVRGNRGPPPAGSASARRRASGRASGSTPSTSRPCSTRREGPPVRRRDPQGQSLAAPSRPSSSSRRASPTFTGPSGSRS